MTETVRTIAGHDFVATPSREVEIIGRCFDCGEAIDNTPADRRYAVVTPNGRLYCSGDCERWCAKMHDDFVHIANASREGFVSYWV